MGFTEILTIIFIVLKLLGKIDWSWFFVLLPEIIAFAVYIVIVICSAFGVGRASRTITKHFKDM